MNTTLLEKVNLLPPDKQQEVEDYAEFLLQKYQQSNDVCNNELAESRRKLAGRLKGQIWMADDFNETPEDFKDYM